MKYLSNIMTKLADENRYLFTPADLRCAFPEKSYQSIKTLLSRSVKAGILKRVCSGLYLYPAVKYPDGFVLFHAAARLRASELNYISLETALSDAGVISQIPMNWITLMSSGRSYVVNCGTFGHIEFIHTQKRASALAPHLTYDPQCRLWRASEHLARQDMLDTKRNTDLITTNAGETGR